VVPTLVTSIVSTTPVLEQLSQRPTCFIVGHRIGSTVVRVLAPASLGRPSVPTSWRHTK